MTRIRIATFFAVIVALFFVDGIFWPDLSLDSETVTVIATEQENLAMPIETPRDESPPEIAEETALPLEPEELVNRFIDTVYESYLSFEDADLRQTMDFSVRHNNTFRTWISMINQRRRLLLESGLCFVDTMEKPYNIKFLKEDELEDDRLERWKELGAAGIDPSETERLLHFVVTGTPGEAYPPFMAVNSQQTIRVRQRNDEWRIVWQYYPGAIRSFRSTNIEIVLQSDNEVLEALQREFAEAVQLPEKVAYNGAMTVSYALEHAETPNEDFYRISDWMGNCANFASQCIWAGLHGENELSVPYDGKYMNSRWFAGTGGGSPAWENVDYLWDYALVGLRPAFPENVNSLLPGDIIQTRTPGHEAEGRYSHTMVLVDIEKMIMAQNSPNNFVYYSDLVNSEYRFFRPAMG